MRPSRTLLLLLLVWVILGLTTALANIFSWQAAIQINLAFWTYCVVLALVSLADYLLARQSPKLKVTRTLDPHLALGVRQRVLVKVSNESTSRQQLWLTDSPSAQLHMSGLPVKAQIAPGEHFVVRYYVTPLQRGLAEFAQVCCRILFPSTRGKSVR